MNADRSQIRIPDSHCATVLAVLLTVVYAEHTHDCASGARHNSVREVSVCTYQYVSRKLPNRHVIWRLLQLEHLLINELALLVYNKVGIQWTFCAARILCCLRSCTGSWEGNASEP